jgi:hypothetical protein
MLIRLHPWGLVATLATEAVIGCRKPAMPPVQQSTHGEPSPVHDERSTAPGRAEVSALEAGVPEAGSPSALLEACSSPKRSNSAERQVYERGLLNAARWDVAGTLQDVQEPPLTSIDPQSVTAYRWGRLHGTTSKVIRVEFDGRRCIAHATLRRNMLPECEIRHAQMFVQQSDCQSLANCLISEGFWNSPADSTRDLAWISRMPGGGLRMLA